MKKDLIIKNFISKSFLNHKKFKKDVKVANKYSNKIINQIEKVGNFFHLFSKNFKFNFNKNSTKRFQKFNSIIIIGMGGSILGTKAFYTFLSEKIKKKVIFIDNLNSYELSILAKKKILKKSLFIIISKSGNTLETLANTMFFKNKINKKNSIIITESKPNLLQKTFKKRKILNIAHKKYIGGRYSVLSEVGMLPAYLMGLNPQKFRSSITKYLKKQNRTFLINSSSILSQKFLYKKFNAIIFFNYCPRLNEFVFWCQQLLSESLGKSGRGMLPTLSPAPKDNHSLLQLYLDGPKDKVFYILSSNDKKNKKIDKIVNAQKAAFIEILKKRKIPFRTIQVNNFTESAIGELFSYFMLETIFLGKLLNVNPFNQPAVEEVKVLTKKKLR